MRTHTGVATTMFEALAAAGINIQMITTSEIKISVLVDRASAVPALRAVHQAFLLDRVGAGPSPFVASRKSPVMDLVPLADNDAGAVEPRALGMEDLVIAGVELDETQARITLFHVPDRPGYAARVFRAIADAGVFVDMIVQNVGIAGDSVLSFTVPREAADRAVGGRQVRRGARGLRRAGDGQALGHRRRHADPHGRRHPDVRRAGRSRDQRQPDQHQRGPHQRRHRHRRGREGLECLRRAFAL